MTMGDGYLRMNVDATRNLLDAASDDPKRHTPKLVRQLHAIGYRVTLDEWGPRSIRAILTTALGAVVR